MKHYAADATTQAAWKSHPIRIRGPRSSPCCAQPTILVQGMRGGLVNANCSKVGCNGKDNLTRDEFEGLDLWVDCPGCRRKMLPDMIEKNYVYACRSCALYVRLADLLPSWDQLERQ
jgi:hypothetical protein